MINQLQHSHWNTPIDQNEHKQILIKLLQKLSNNTESPSNVNRKTIVTTSPFTMAPHFLLLKAIC
jgi:hypothetical protein